MDVKGSIRGIKKLMGLQSSLPVKPSGHDSGEQGLLTTPTRSSVYSSYLSGGETSLAKTSVDSDNTMLIPSPTFNERRSYQSGRFGSSSLRQKASLAFGMKPRRLEIPENSLKEPEQSIEDSMLCTSPIPVPTLHDVVLPNTKGRLRTQSLEEYIHPEGYATSLVSVQEEVPIEHARPSKPPQMTSSSMDEVFVVDSPGPVRGTGSDVSAPVNRQTHLKRPSTGHVNHFTGDWHSNDPARPAIIGTAETGPAIIKATGVVLLQAKAAIIEDTEGKGLPDEGVVRGLREDVRTAPGHLLSLSVCSECKPPKDVVSTAWHKLSTHEASHIVHDVIFNQTVIEESGIHAFIQAIISGTLTPSDHPLFFTDYVESSRKGTISGHGTSIYALEKQQRLSDASNCTTPDLKRPLHSVVSGECQEASDHSSKKPERLPNTVRIASWVFRLEEEKSARGAGLSLIKAIAARRKIKIPFNDSYLEPTLMRHLKNLYFHTWHAALDERYLEGTWMVEVDRMYELTRSLQSRARGNSFAEILEQRLPVRSCTPGIDKIFHATPAMRIESNSLWVPKIQPKAWTDPAAAADLDLDCGKTVNWMKGKAYESETAYVDDTVIAPKGETLPDSLLVNPSAMEKEAKTKNWEKDCSGVDVLGIFGQLDGGGPPAPWIGLMHEENVPQFSVPEWKENVPEGSFPKAKENVQNHEPYP